MPTQQVGEQTGERREQDKHLKKKTQESNLKANIRNHKSLKYKGLIGAGAYRGLIVCL